MALSEILRAPRASALRVELPDGSEVTIPAPSLQQAADCLSLDPREGAPAESPRGRVARLHRQATILLGPAHAHLTGKLTMQQVAEIVQALYLAASGIDPAAFVEYQQTLQQRSAEEVLASVQNLVIDMAAELKLTPAEAAKMPVADAVSLREKLASNTDQRARFEAALHGKTLE